jgi:hypothetical protein
VDEHEDLLEVEAPSSDLQKSKERFIKVYVRQLSLPLVGNEETLKEFESKLAQFCVEADLALVKIAELEKKLAAAREMREGRLIYEMHLLSDKYTASSTEEKDTFWLGYIAYEKKQNQLSRAQRLYERAVMDSPHSTALWLEFTDFALSTLKNWSLLSSVTTRALKLAPFRHSLFLWKLRLLGLECTGAPGEDIQAAVQAALALGFANVEEYLELYLCHADYHRRKLSALREQQHGTSTVSTAVAEQAAGLRQALSAALAFLEAYGVQWVAGWWRLCKYQSQLEGDVLCWAESAQSSETAMTVEDDTSGAALSFGSKKAGRGGSKPKAATKQLAGCGIWETAMKAFPSSYFLVTECVNWAVSVGAVEYSRKLLRRATNLTLDTPAAEVCKDWVRFEELHGSVPDLQAAMSRCLGPVSKALLAEVQLAQQPQSANTAEAVASASTAHSESAITGSSAPLSEGKRKRTSEDTTSKARTSASASVTTDAPESSVPKRVKFEEPTVTAESSVQPVQALVLSDTTVVVSNFPFAASLETLRPMLLDKCTNIPAEALEEAGAVASPVEDMRLVLTKAGHSRGMVEVYFPAVSADDAGALVARRKFLQIVADTLNGYVYNNRVLKAEVQVLTPHKPAAETAKADPLAAQRKAGSLASPHLTTVFVSHFGSEVTSAQLKEHFSACGEILAAKVATDKKTGVSKVRPTSWYCHDI